jgi:hypothetical protein
MRYSKSVMAFEDVREAFDRALEAPKGIRIPCPTRSAAMELRSRFNYFRKLDRAESSETYKEGHPLHSKSIYDRLVLRVPSKGSPEENVLIIEPRSISTLNIEEIQ